MSDTADEWSQRLANERHTQIIVLLADVRDRIQIQNGRIGTLERQVAVLEDRSPGRVGMITGSVGAGLVAVLYEMIQLFATRHR